MRDSRRIKKLLLTGASGFLGWNLCRRAAGTHRVYGLFHAHPIEIPGVSAIGADIADFAGIARIFREVRPDAVIHAAAISDPNFCQENPEKSRKINLDASANIAGLCSDLGASCVFTSTDLVFDGLNAPYREEDPVGPVSVYGEHKALAERAMMERCERVAVCRMPLMFGDPGPVARSFIQPMVRAMRQEIELQLFSDEYRTPASGKAAAEGILSVPAKGLEGIIHLGGPERISRYEFGLLLAGVLGVPNPKVRACLRREVAPAAPRPRDVSLDSTKAFRLGYRPGPLRRELEQLLPVL